MQNINQLLYPQRLFNLALPKIKKVVDGTEERTKGSKKAREGDFLFLSCHLAQTEITIEMIGIITVVMCLLFSVQINMLQVAFHVFMITTHEKRAEKVDLELDSLELTVELNFSGRDLA